MTAHLAHHCWVAIEADCFDFPLQRVCNALVPMNGP